MAKRNPTLFRTLALIAPLSLACGSCRVRPPQPPALLLDATATPNPASPFEPFTPASWLPYALDQFKNQSLKGGFDLFSLDFMDFAKIGGDFQISIDEQDDGYFLRQERWKLRTDIGPGALIQDALGVGTMPLSIRLVAGKEIIYGRAFTDLKQATLAKPVSILGLPTKAQTARAMMAGDFVSIPTNMGIVLGLEALNDRKPFAVSAGTGFFWNGEFRINIYRQEGGFVRVKIAPSTQRGFEMHANIGARLDMFGYSPGRLINYDRQAERFFGLDFFAWARNRVLEGQKYAFDYVFNLDDSSARIAYDAIMDKTVSFKSGFKASLGATSLFRSEVNADNVFVDLTPAEYLNLTDQGRPADERRVARVFKGSNFYQGDSSAGRLGLRALRFQESRSLTSNRLAIDDGLPGGSATAQIFVSEHRRNSWLSYFRQHQSLSAGAFFECNANWRRHTLRDLIFEWNIGQSDLSPNELSEVRQAYMVILGGDYKRLLAGRRLMGHEGQGGQGHAKRFSSALKVVIRPDFMLGLSARLSQSPGGLEEDLAAIGQTILLRYRSGRSSLEFFQEASEGVARGAWRGLEGGLMDPMIKATVGLNRLGEGNYLGELFKIMNSHPAGEIIVPTFILELAKYLRTGQYLAIMETARGTPDYFNDIGEDLGGEYRARLTRALYAISHLGYEN